MHERFLQLDSFLTTHQEFWRFEPFLVSCFGVVPWNDSRLSYFLEDLTNAQVEELKSDAKSLNQCLSDFIPKLDCAFKLNQLKRIQLEGLKLDRLVTNGVTWQKVGSNSIYGRGCTEVPLW